MVGSVQSSKMTTWPARSGAGLMSRSPGLEFLFGDRRGVGGEAGGVKAGSFEAERHGGVAAAVASVAFEPISGVSAGQVGHRAAIPGVEPGLGAAEDPFTGEARGFGFGVVDCAEAGGQGA